MTGGISGVSQKNAVAVEVGVGQQLHKEAEQAAPVPHAACCPLAGATVAACINALWAVPSQKQCCLPDGLLTAEPRAQQLLCCWAGSACSHGANDPLHAASSVRQPYKISAQHGHHTIPTEGPSVGQTLLLVRAVVCLLPTR